MCFVGSKPGSGPDSPWSRKTENEITQICFILDQLVIFLRALGAFEHPQKISLKLDNQIILSGDGAKSPLN